MPTLKDLEDPIKFQQTVENINRIYQELLQKDQDTWNNRYIPPENETDEEILARIKKTGLITCSKDLLTQCKSMPKGLTKEEVSALLKGCDCD